MIDIHSHLLFGVDDGSRTLEESVHVIKKLSEVGYTDIILTPHYINDSTYVSTREENLDVLKSISTLFASEKSASCIKQFFIVSVNITPLKLHFFKL